MINNRKIVDFTFFNIDKNEQFVEDWFETFGAWMEMA